MQHRVVVTLTGGLVAASIVTVGRQIIQHLRHYTEPSLQVFIVRILLMIPVNFCCHPIGLRDRLMAVHLLA